jgi:hypothetical protein
MPGQFSVAINSLVLLAVAGLVLAGVALAAVFFANRPPPVLSRDEGLACIAERCTEAANACTAAVDAAEAACVTAAVTDQCGGIESALQRRDCELDGRRECQKAAEAQGEACGAEGAICYASCGPREQTRPHFWCTGRMGETQASFFCEGDPANPSSVQICIERREWQNLSSSLICQQLRATTSTP